MTAKIIIVCGVLLIIYAIVGTVNKARGKAKSSCCGTGEVVIKKSVDDTDESHYPYRYKLNVEGMACSNCAVNVENAINSMGDVWARVDLGRKEADVLAKHEHNEGDFRKALSTTSYKLAGYSQL